MSSLTSDQWYLFIWPQYRYVFMLWYCYQCLRSDTSHVPYHGGQLRTGVLSSIDKVTVYSAVAICINIVHACVHARVVLCGVCYQRRLVFLAFFIHVWPFMHVDTPFNFFKASSCLVSLKSKHFFPVWETPSCYLKDVFWLQLALMALIYVSSQQ